MGVFALFSKSTKGQFQVVKLRFNLDSLNPWSLKNCRIEKASLNIPPFLNGRKCLMAQEEMETKRIAKQRIYIEHAIGRIKQFR